MLSQTVQHALRAVLYLAQQPAGAVVPANRIAEATGAPPRYLAKTLQGLAASGLVRGTRGREGGYTLALGVEEITVGAVMAAFESQERPRLCLLGDRECSPATPCAAHTRWRAAQHLAWEAVSAVRIEDLLTGAVALAADGGELEVGNDDAA